MNYDQAKRNFEYHVQAMRKDLLKWAQRDDASQTAINIRTEQLNAFIDYFNVAERLISDHDETVHRTDWLYQRLHGDANKLVLFCMLHRINPNMVFHYTVTELMDMYYAGIRFMPPAKNFERFRFSQEGETISSWYQEQNLDEDTMARQHECKYFTLKQQLEARA